MSDSPSWASAAGSRPVVDGMVVVGGRPVGGPGAASDAYGLGTGEDGMGCGPGRGATGAGTGGAGGT